MRQFRERKSKNVVKSEIISSNLTIHKTINYKNNLFIYPPYNIQICK